MGGGGQMLLVQSTSTFTTSEPATIGDIAETGRGWAEGKHELEAVANKSCWISWAVKLA